MAKKRKVARRRRLQVERLDLRRLLAVDWQNPFNLLDVTDDGLVTRRDALVGINRLNLLLGPDFPEPSTAPPYYDAKPDCLHTPFDVLVVINALNAVQPPPDLIIALE